MSRQHRSISQRLARAGSPEARQETVLAWVQAWQAEQSRLIDELGRAVACDDFDALCQLVGQLRAVTEKRFRGLGQVLQVPRGGAPDTQVGNIT